MWMGPPALPVRQDPQALPEPQVPRDPQDLREPPGSPGLRGPRGRHPPCPDQQVLQGQPGRRGRVLPVRREQPDPRVRAALLVRPVPLDLLVRRGLRVLRVRPVLREHQEARGQLGPRDPPVPQEPQDRRERVGLLVVQDRRVPLDQQGPPDLLDLQVLHRPWQVPLVPQVRPQPLPALQGLLAPPGLVEAEPSVCSWWGPRMAVRSPQA